MHATPRYPCALTIAGSDSGGGAGIQADLKTFAAFAVYGASVITAVTAQNSLAVRAVHNIPPHVIAAQLDAVLEDLPIRVVKIGMLSTADTIRVVAERLRAHAVATIVLDPVLVATSGDPLLHDAAVEALLEHLFPLATLITPNLPEAARLLHMDSIDDAGTATRALLGLGAKAVLLKGGHGSGETLEDYLLMAGMPEPLRYCHAQQRTRHTHGTGCSLSSAIAAGLAHGEALAVATEHAIGWLQHAIAHAWPLGAGHGPVHHFWQYWPNSMEGE
ncbi:MAG TPA: bifunctional hydroxymethylpyrimidine kinase/phosphomethylpyrimidine kinase [Armatimonadota bacterium]